MENLLKEFFNSKKESEWNLLYHEQQEQLEKEFAVWYKENYNFEGKRYCIPDNVNTKAELAMVQRYNHDKDYTHQSEMNRLIEAEEYSLFSILKPTLSKDGNKWCVLYGDNLQVGIAGFGDTPYKAILAWNKEWHRSIA